MPHNHRLSRCAQFSSCRICYRTGFPEKFVSASLCFLSLFNSNRTLAFHYGCFHLLSLPVGFNKDVSAIFFSVHEVLEFFEGTMKSLLLPPLLVFPLIGSSIHCRKVILTTHIISRLTLVLRVMFWFSKTFSSWLKCSFSSSIRFLTSLLHFPSVVIIETRHLRWLAFL